MNAGEWIQGENGLSEFWRNGGIGMRDEEDGREYIEDNGDVDVEEFLAFSERTKGKGWDGSW